jgi:oxygen-independent coproporphyrinogen-3 oxidase
VPLEPGAEVTLEANPGTAEAGRFRGYREAGVNRLSLGIQSFDDAKLAALGRIHSAAEARRAIEMAQVEFDNVNLDIMYGLPQQTLDQALADARAALAFGTTHFSAYQLTLEPNTVFYSKPPPLPAHDLCADMQLAVEDAAAEAGFEHYETSAFARPGRQCRHNLNYWEFGDYLGLGAGAHGKLSFPDHVTRHERVKQPREYLAQAGSVVEKPIAAKELPFEFMLNALRLVNGVPTMRFEERTGLPLAAEARRLAAAAEKGLLERDPARIRPTRRGRLFLNELLQVFLD